MTNDIFSARARRLLPMLFWLAVAMVPTTRATVYTLRPGVRTHDLESVLQSKSILSDRIVINGREGTLDVSIIKQPFAELPGLLTRYVEGLAVDIRAASLLIEGPAQGGRLRRYYIVSMGEPYRTLMFTMDIPADLRNAEIAWPSDLPLPRGASPEQVMELRGRKMLYASFRASRPAAALSSGYHAELTGDGWHLLGTQPSTGVYTRGREILFLNVSATPRGGSLATLCRKHLDVAPLPKSK